MYAYCERCILLTFRQEELPVVGKTLSDVRKVWIGNRGLSLQSILEPGATLERINQGLCQEIVRRRVSVDGQGMCEREGDS